MISLIQVLKLIIGFCAPQCDLWHISLCYCCPALIHAACIKYVVSTGIQCYDMASMVSCRAAEKLNLTSRKRGQASDPAPALSSTCFRELIQKTPPPVPPCLLQAATRTRDSPAVAKVHSLAPNSSRYIVGRVGFCAICNNYSNSLHVLF